MHPRTGAPNTHAPKNELKAFRGGCHCPRMIAAASDRISRAGAGHTATARWHACSERAQRRAQEPRRAHDETSTRWQQRRCTACPATVGYTHAGHHHHDGWHPPRPVGGRKLRVSMIVCALTRDHTASSCAPRAQTLSSSLRSSSDSSGDGSDGSSSRSEPRSTTPEPPVNAPEHHHVHPLSARAQRHLHPGRARKFRGRGPVQMAAWLRTRHLLLLLWVYVSTSRPVRMYATHRHRQLLASLPRTYHHPPHDTPTHRFTQPPPPRG